MKLKLPKKVLNVFVICCTIILIGLLGLFIYNNRDLLNKKNPIITTDELQSNVQNALKEYNNYLAVIDILKTSANGEEFSSQEAFSNSKESTYNSYIYRDSDDNDLYQCWYYDEELKVYPTKIYDGEHKVWVETNLEQPYNSIDAWTLFDDLSYYEVSEDIIVWEDTGDECYVLNAINTDVAGAQIYEEIYIRKSDFLPLGILTYGFVEIDETQSEEVELEEATAVIETKKRDEIMQKITVEYSNKDLSLFESPKDYISEEEYRKLKGAELEE